MIWRMKRKGPDDLLAVWHLQRRRDTGTYLTVCGRYIELKGGAMRRGAIPPGACAACLDAIYAQGQETQKGKGAQ